MYAFHLGRGGTSEDWHGYLHNATIADAILDRIVHNAYKIEFNGNADSQRKKNAKEAMK